MDLDSIIEEHRHLYGTLRQPVRAIARDLFGLVNLGAVDEITDDKGQLLGFRVRLTWPTEITETEFFRRLRMLPKAKSLPFG